MTLAHVYIWGAVPFVIATICFGFIKGENDFYDTDKYGGDGTAHKVLK